MDGIMGDSSMEIGSLYEDLIGEFKMLAEREGSHIIALDGRCGSGKTTFAAMLKRIFDCNVFHMDDFFLPQEMKTEERLSEPGGNVHYERVLQEVILPLSRGEAVQLIPFNCSVNDLGQTQTVPFKKLNFIEGVYSLHPFLEPYYDYKIFMTIDAETQVERIAKRNPSKIDRFINEWIPLEESYFRALQIEGKADHVIQASKK